MFDVHQSSRGRRSERRLAYGVLPKFYTIEQIADCLSVSSRTVRRWIDAGLLIAHRFNGIVRISEADFAAFWAARRDV
jgi:excisionase family DNA binding protein